MAGQCNIGKRYIDYPCPCMKGQVTGLLHTLLDRKLAASSLELELQCFPYKQKWLQVLYQNQHALLVEDKVPCTNADAGPIFTAMYVALCMYVKTLNAISIVLVLHAPGLPRCVLRGNRRDPQLATSCCCDVP